MTDKELVKKLNSLKSVKPEASWKAGNRDLLLSQITNSGAHDLSPWKLFSINFNSFVKATAQPAYALGIFVFVLISGGLFSHQVFNSAKPNDSLYIARIVSERAKLSTVFNSEDRNKLAVKFALEHAQDISTMLADPSFNTEENKDQVAKLNESFNQEIENVKTRISYLAPKKVIEQLETQTETTTNEVDGDLFSIAAGDGKDDKGLQLAEVNIVSAPEVTKASVKVTSTSETKTEAETASQTEEMVVMVAPEISTSSNLITDTILNEAKQLSEIKDYQRVSEKLREVGELIK